MGILFSAIQYTWEQLTLSHDEANQRFLHGINPSLEAPGLQDVIQCHNNNNSIK